MISRKLALVLALSSMAYAAVIRPRLLRWGATDEEVQGPYPGAELIPGGTRGATNAITIDAPPAKVWPWLVQMGYGRAGWYSWDYLDNLGRPSADALHHEWQQLAIGDHLGPSFGGFEVAALEPERFLGLRASFALLGGSWYDQADQPPVGYSGLWGFLLEELPGDRTRLVVSGYWAARPAWLYGIVSVVFLDPAHWVMQTRQFANLKRQAEAEAKSAASAAS